MENIKLGDKVRCKITGFTGIAVVRSEFLNGCIQWSVLSKMGKDNKMPEEIGIDEKSLEIIPTPKKKVVKKEENGGAMTRGFVRRNF